MSKIMVQNNHGGMVQVQLRPDKPAAAGKRGDVNLGKVLTLGPGFNAVDKADWEAAKKNPTVQAMMQERIPRSNAPEQDPAMVGRIKLVEGDEVASENPLADMNPLQALRVVEETLDVNVLGLWLQTEQRADV